MANHRYFVAETSVFKKFLQDVSPGFAKLFPASETHICATSHERRLVQMSEKLFDRMLNLQHRDDPEFPPLDYYESDDYDDPPRLMDSAAFDRRTARIQDYNQKRAAGIAKKS